MSRKEAVIVLLLVALCVIVPFTAFFVMSGNPVFGALAFNFVLVVAGLMSILFGNYQDFGALVASRAAIERKSRIDPFVLQAPEQFADAGPGGGSDQHEIPAL